MEVRILDGDGAIHAPGSRGVHCLSVAVTDETGAPVPHATVNFRVPDQGPTGVFASGLRTDLATTDNAGRATIPALQFNRTAGEFQIHITAARDAARASVVSTQYISESHVAGHKRGRWLAAGLAIAGGAGASLALIEHNASHPAAVTDPNALSIGAPAISIGKPK